MQFVLRLVKNCVILDYDCSSSYLSSNVAAVRKYIYYIT
jgi:hypothetical protein